ncbi:neural cell adhesion molecule 2-like isoform X2 [Tachypleus tridentatus]|uniref:neural cell adhesion molecule 2-like isoform X2 n=1 Tax=Tachypleus tridentatus TaxID=6853 RepID=UPI003FD456E2
MTNSLFCGCFYLLMSAHVIHSGVPGIKLKPVHYYDEQKEYAEYSSVMGRKLVLPCNITPPSPDDRVSLVLWYRGTSGNPLYSVDARNMPVEKAKHVIRDEYVSRTSLNITKRVASLVIEPVEEADAGEYRCRVDYQRGRTSHRKLKVNVIVPPKKIFIRHGEHVFEDSNIGPFDEGSHLNLTCEAVGAKPPPVVTWWRKSTLLDDTYWNDSELTINDLDIPYLHRNYSMAPLTCNASNTNFTSPTSITVKLNLNLKPQTVHISSPRTPLLTGREIEVTCESQGSLPPAEVTWWMEGEELKESRKSLTNKITTSHVTVKLTKEDNGKELVCRAQNPRLSESALEDSWKLNVHYKPELSLKLRSNDQGNEVKEGSDIYLDCNINANPQYRELQWMFDDHRLFSGPENGIEIHGLTLMIKNVTREHEGGYYCTAENSVGKGQSNNILLVVLFSPICASRQKINYGVGRHEEAEISCELTAQPQEVEFHWRFNTSGDIGYFQSNRTTSIATLSLKSKYDYGTLYCWGENRIGVQKEPCVFHIIPAARPEPVTNCSIENQTEKSFMVVCSSGDDGGLIQQFHLEVFIRNSQALLMNHTRFDQPVFEVTDLTPGSPLRIMVYASNVKGKSPAVLLETRMLLSVEKHTENVLPLFISPLLAVLLGIIMVLVTLAVIILIIVKRRRTRLQQGVALDLSNEHKSNEQIKSIDDQPEPEDKCPDVVPPRNLTPGTEFDDMVMNPAIKMADLGNQRIYENLRIERDRTYENVIAQQEFLPNQLVKNTDVEHTEYANIDHQRSDYLRPCSGMETEEEMDGYSVETPLMNSLKSDRRGGRTDWKRPVVSTVV